MSLNPIIPQGPFAQLKGHASWIMAFGVLLIILGLFALGSVLTATIATVFYVGVMMLFAGAAEIFVASQARSWSGFFMWLGVGALSALAGTMTLSNPILAAGILTLMLGISMTVAGIGRIYLAFHLKEGAPWAVMAFSGALTILVGAMILSQWPTSSVYTLGMFLGLDLLFVGFSWLNMGWALRRPAA